ncbi:MAG: PAS domain S-box protein [Bacteroidales bacterium]|nr:PAS domain S-box protein [Bacteroidales bacterium]
MQKENEILVLDSEAIELSAYSIFIVVDDKIQYVNRALLELSGYDKNELIGEPFLKFIAPEEQENVKKHYYKRVKGKKAPWSYESVAVIKSGEQFPVEISVMPVLYKEEKGYQVIGHDISKRKKAENELIRSRQEWEAIFQASGQPTMLESPDHKILSVNKATKDLTGLDEKELIGKKCFEILHGTKKPPEGCPAEKLLKSGTTNTVEMEIESLDRIFLISTTPRTNAEGKIDKIIHVATDITEQKQAQAEITKHREYYRAVFENTGAASVIIEEDTSISLANKRFETLSGYTKADIEGKKRWTDFVVREDLERMKKQHELRRKNSAKAKTNYEFRFIDRYKELKYILLSVDIIPGTKKSIASLIDITEHKKADNEIRHLNSLLSAIRNVNQAITKEDNLNDMISKACMSLVTTRGYTACGASVTNRNNESISVFIQDGKENIIKDWDITSERIDKAPSCIMETVEKQELLVRQTAKCTNCNAAAEKSAICVNLPLKSSMGLIGVLHIEMENQEIMNEEKELLIEVADDLVLGWEKITSREILQENEVNLRNIFSAAPAGIGTLDNRILQEVNEKVSEITGYSRDEMIGNDIRMLYVSNKEYIKAGILIYRDLEKYGTGTMETQFKTKEGKIIDVLINTACADKNKPMDNITFTILDISDKKHAERNLENAMLKAQESDSLKTAFLANMSHEIRTPMNGIMGFAGLLKEPKLTGKERNDFIDLIEKSGIRMLNTINDIMDISRIESGLVQVNNTQTQINTILKEKYDFFSSEAEIKHLKLTYNTGLHDSDAIILTDPIKLNGILTNLIKNALKYTDKGSVNFGYKPLWNKRHVRDNSSPDQLEFYVKDTGIGVPFERQEAIFNRFEQADIGDKRAFEGSGLGLAISKAYVEMLGGTIQVDSEPGAGSVFSFTIPYKCKFEKQTVTGKKIISQVQQDMLKKLNVIVAEDDQTSRFYFETIMSGKFKDVNFTSSGGDTIKALKNNPDTDLILMDIKMPGMDGYEATREIRKFNNDVLIIAQTAYGLSSDRQKALDAGCNEYLTKPVRKNILFEKLVSCLKERS